MHINIKAGLWTLGVLIAISAFCWVAMEETIILAKATAGILVVLLTVNIFNSIKSLIKRKNEKVYLGN